MLRTMQKARYDAQNLRALRAGGRRATRTSRRRFAATPTSSCTAPCASRVTGMSDGAQEELTDELPEIARHTSERERRAADAERELVQWKKVRFMADKVGDEFDGYITGVARVRALHRARRTLRRRHGACLDDGR